MGAGAMDEWVKWGINHRGWSGGTPALYRRRAIAADRWMKQQGWAGVTRGRPEHYMAWWDSLPGSASSRNLARNVLMAYGLWMVTTGQRAHNPATVLPSWRNKRPPPRPMSHAEAMRVVALIAGHTSRAAVASTLMLHCGLRVSETVTVRWLDYDGSWMTVLGKGGHTRRVPTPDPVVTMLRRWQVATFQQVTILPNCTTDRIRREVRALTGHNPHVARHTFATELLEATGDVRLVQVALGHRSLASTQIYTQVRPDRLASSVQKMYAA